MTKKLFLITITILITLKLAAQSTFPQGYFIMPINPGKPVSLSGAFGDIRVNHFHAGLDIRTGGAEGKPVHAAADGYVSRIKIQNGGYGNALYITHPNGYTTVYAHLKVLNDTLQKYLIKQQYQQQQWEVDVEIPAGSFAVKQGEIVALSGNTGGSGGPHLHFEIRDALEKIWDPSQFGFVELRDYISPVIEFISLKTMSIDARINGRFGMFNFPVTKQKDGTYTVNQIIKAKGLIGLEINTYDKTSNGPFRQGINQINVQINGERAYDFKGDSFEFHNKLDMNCHVNYEKLIKKGQKIHKCYVEEGNTLKNYFTNFNKGKFEIIKDFNSVNINVFDSFKNNSFLYFTIEKQNDNYLPEVKPTDINKVAVTDNFLSIEIPNRSSITNSINLFFGGTNKNINLPADSAKLQTLVFDLNDGVPSQIKINDSYQNIPVNTKISIAQPTITRQSLNADFSLALFNTNYLSTDIQDYKLKLHDDIIPLKGLADVSWTKYTAPTYPNKYKVYLDERKPKYIGGDWVGSTINFKTKEYGSFITLFDFEPPAITPRIINNDKIILKISDALSGIQKIDASINGEWLLMNFEYKSGLIWAEKLYKTKPFEGNLVITITDYCGNSQVFNTLINPKI